MNKIKFEFFGNCADIASADYDGSDKVKFIFPTADEGYLSVGPRLLKVVGGEVEIDLKAFADGVMDCYLCIKEIRYELPGLEKLGRLFRMSGPSEGSAMARVVYLKEQEARIEMLEMRLSEAEKKIFGRGGIL